MENQFLKVGDFMDAIGKIKIIMHTGKYDLKKEKILNGEIIEEINIHNIIVNSASKILANCLAGKTGFNINNVKLGTISNQNENHKITNLSSTNTINIDINEKFDLDIEKIRDIMRKITKILLNVLVIILAIVLFIAFLTFITAWAAIG